MAHRKGVLFHTDAVQAFGHIPIDVNYLRGRYAVPAVTNLTAQKGVGFLCVRNPKVMMPLIYGGGQERAARGWNGKCGRNNRNGGKAG
ncbi:MAG: aminotransferase class V-fold PLP-dependent enzyme [Eubacterium ventriosum]